MKILFNLTLIQQGVAVRVQQTGGRCQDRTLTVKVYRSPFHDNSRVDYRDLVVLCNKGWNIIVQVKGWILSTPCIVAPVNDNLLLFRTGVDHECGTMVSTPSVICRVHEKFHPP